MNRKLLIIPTIALTMGLSSCNKNSRSNVLKFVRENYKNVNPRKPINHEIKWDFSKSVGDSAKAFAIVIIIDDFTEGKSDELNGEYSFKSEEIRNVYPLNEDWFEIEYDSHNYCKFTINNKELTVTHEVENSYKKEIVYNSDGYRRYEKETYNIKDEKNRCVNGTTERIYSY